MSEINVAICGLIGSPNLGERFIADSLEYLIKDEFYQRYGRDNSIVTKQIDLSTEDDFLPGDRKRILFLIYRALRRIQKRCPIKTIRNALFAVQHFCWRYGRAFRPRFYKHYSELLEHVDAIVVDGAGLLEYSYNEYQEVLLLIGEIAEEKNIPLIYNAVGIAGDYDPSDYRCKILTKAMRSPSLRYVSCRDSQDIVQKYVGERLPVMQVADAVVCLNRAYTVEKKCEKPLVGIGLIRGTALQSYGLDFDSDGWLNLFSEIANELTRRGYAYEFFTNGLPSDHELGKRLLKKMRLQDRFLVERPTDSHVLADTISRYSVMITCRMHSIIAGFSMGIPAIALSWNQKLNKFMNYIGHDERVIDYQEFDAKRIVDKMENALLEGYSSEEILKYQNSARESVRSYIERLNPLK